MFPLELLGLKTYPAKFARNLGVIFDKNFNFFSLITVIYSSCIYHIRDLQRARFHLDLESAILLANAVVSSRLDCRNSLWSGIADADLAKPQDILNRLAHVVTVTTICSQCSTAAFASLATSIVKYRFHFKICLMTYEAFYEQPVYLRSLIATSLPSRSLRSNGGITLSVRRIRTKTGVRAFSSCTPSLRSNLPLSVHSAPSLATFRRRLKTYLCDLALPQ